MDYKSDITKLKILSNVESEEPAFHYKSTKFNKINDNFSSFFKKRIQFSSAFDHIGSKQFLRSKKAALEQIVIDENNISSNNEDIQSNNNNKRKSKKREKYRYRKSDKNRPKSSDDVLEYTKKKKLRKKTYDKIETKSKSRKSRSKSKSKSRSKSKGKSKEKEKEKESIIKSYCTKELDISKKLEKCYSSQELKMFNDEEINKIKPIKSNFNKMKTKKTNLLNKNFHFIGSEKSIDSIFKVVSEMDN